MSSAEGHPLKLSAEVERWRLKESFRITGYTFDALTVMLVSIEQNGAIGRGEAAGVYYRDDTPARMLSQVMSVRSRVEAGISQSDLQGLLPPGGARNALDCALWDLRAKVTGKPVWQLAGLNEPKPLMTTFTCAAADPETMAAKAGAYRQARALKLKLTGEPDDVDRVRAVRSARPDVWLSVDANQGFTRESLRKLMPVLLETKVSLIEQPFPVGHEKWLDHLESPIPIAADESVQSFVDVAGLSDRVQMINIKLDKCGGLTEALAMARAAREFGLEMMVGNMLGTSLAMAPAWVVGQLCAVADLDGPIFLERDRQSAVDYTNGRIVCPESLWGGTQ